MREKIKHFKQGFKSRCPVQPLEKNRTRIRPSNTNPNKTHPEPFSFNLKVDLIEIFKLKSINIERMLIYEKFVTRMSIPDPDPALFSSAPLMYAPSIYAHVSN